VVPLALFSLMLKPWLLTTGGRFWFVATSSSDTTVTVAVSLSPPGSATRDRQAELRGGFIVHAAELETVSAPVLALMAKAPLVLPA